MVSVKNVLLGYDRAISAKFIGLAAVLFAIFTSITYAPQGLFSLSSTHYFQLITVGSFVGATICAYYKGGLLVSWLLAGVGLLPFALSFALSDAPLGNEPTLLGGLVTLLSSAGLFGVVIGTAGFLVGVGLRRFSVRKMTVG